MPIHYETYGPFDLERDGNKVRKEALVAFWRHIQISEPHLPDAVGVYIVTLRLRSDSAAKPWYVGKTERQGFRSRFKQQLVRFGDVLDCSERGRLQIYLLARTNQKRDAFISTTVGRLAYNDELESLVIGSCLTKNPKLINASKVKHLTELIVPGFLNSRGRTRAAAALGKMLGTSKVS